MQLKQTADREDIYMRIVVEKYHGLGNDYLVYDPNKNKLKLTPSNVQLMCNRNFGVGADGILEGPVLDGEQISMVVWNPDGSVAQKSGNGVRIFAKYLKDAGYVQKKDFTTYQLDILSHRFITANSEHGKYYHKR